MLLIVTGGTIDKMPVYLPDQVTFDTDSKVYGEPHLPEMLEKVHFLGEVSVETLFLVDGLDMTDDLRAEVSKVAEASTEDQIVILHGTDTMPKTAKYLERNERLAERTIVLTGAMLPYSVGEDSDAFLTSAVP